MQSVTIAIPSLRSLQHPEPANSCTPEQKPSLRQRHRLQASNAESRIRLIVLLITHMRYLHHPGGAIYGYEQNLKSSVFFFPQEMFIDNLYFASGWVNTCGFGPNYMYGNKIANRILKEMK